MKTCPRFLLLHCRLQENAILIVVDPNDLRSLLKGVNMVWEQYWCFDVDRYHCNIREKKMKVLVDLILAKAHGWPCCRSVAFNLLHLSDIFRRFATFMIKNDIKQYYLTRAGPISCGAWGQSKMVALQIYGNTHIVSYY